ncbi:MAG TPA: tRNA (N(6)-L-threonylcarbamoyladenosine(37)-C(2))-methylthiotransferase MtaB [Bacteroidia bacterium]|nr:tRNA (N(6)-L-threonylcarbamoyladenosine(37)-C(2))-methylthiotransferase MtaB [Bacteroidia bacterium]
MNSARTVAFHTLGCKLNFSETSAIGRQLKEAGFAKREFNEGADVFVINTCSVTENADRECRKIVRDALSVSPEAFIVIIGCYAQLKPEEISAIEGVDLVLGATEKFNLPSYLSEIRKREFADVHSCEIAEADSFVSAWSHGDRTRTFLKVQDGCDYTCSFCTIPLARGKSRSDSIENVIRNAEEIAASGVKEIVLTGINLGDFGKGFHGGKKREENFLELITALDGINGIERFRISSIEPNLLTDEIITFVAQSEKFVPHFHIPLQSGSDRILKLMRRRYLRDVYTQRAEKIKSLMPHCCIGADVITGFPGETEEDFLETYNFLNALDVSYLHVFTYSERANTDAAEMKDVVPVAERKKRTKMLRILSEKKLRRFYLQNAGTVRPVLFESGNRGEVMYGYSDNYVKVKTDYDPSLANKVCNVRIGEPGHDGIAGVSFSTQPDYSFFNT